MEPDHPPEAVHEVASVEDQVSIEGLPLATDAGFAESDTVGAGDVPAEAASVTGSLAPPQAATARVSMGTSSNVLGRNIAVLIPRTA